MAQPDGNSLREPTRSHHVAALDGVRGVAILAVMAFHVVVEIAPGGSVGVDLFFALSGFLITGLLLAELTRTDRVDLRAFYLRRAGRLVPALALFAVVVAPIVADILGTAGVWSNGVKSLLYVADLAAANVALGPLPEPYGHTWSLAVEEQFYLVWPFVLWFAHRARRSPVVLTAVLLAASFPVRWASEASLGGLKTYLLPTGHLWALAVGTLAAALVHRRGRSRLVELSRTTALTVAAWALVVVTVGIPLPRLPAPVLDGYTVLVAAALFVVVVSAATGTTWVSTLLGTRVLRWFGTRSYGLYLFHTALFQVFTRPYVPLSRSVGIMAGLAVSLAVAELSYRYLEQPVRRWSRQRTGAGADPLVTTS